MNVKNIREASDWFEVLQTTKRTQTAVMILKPGKSSGSEPEGHKKSDQVLLVLGGEVEGEIADETVTLREGDDCDYCAARDTRSVTEAQPTRLPLTPIRRRNIDQLW